MPTQVQTCRTMHRLVANHYTTMMIHNLNLSGPSFILSLVLPTYRPGIAG